MCLCLPHGGIMVLQHFQHLSTVFYVKRSSTGSSYGLLWTLGRTQFSVPSRVLRDQWTKHLRAALKTHSMDGYSKSHIPILQSVCGSQ